MKKRILLFFLLISANTHGQGNIQFEKVAIVQGVTIIRDIIQDKLGYIWLGTEDGLLRYDGKRVVKYTPEINNKNSLSHRLITCLHEDAFGKIWIGTEIGLCYFNPIKQDFTRISLDQEIQKIQVNSIIGDKNGTIWIGTEYGLFNINSVTNKIRNFEIAKGKIDLQLKNAINTLSLDNNYLWIGTINGLKRFDIAHEKITRYLKDPFNANSLSNNYIKVLHIDSEKNLWIGTNSGVDKVSKTNTENLVFQHFKNDPLNKYSLSSNSILSIYEDKKQTLWIGTFSGLNWFDKTSNSFKVFKPEIDSKGPFTNDIIYKTINDKTGVFWIVTRDGIYKYNPKKQIFPYYGIAPYLNSSEKIINVYAIYEDTKKRLWIGGLKMGLLCIDHKNKSTIQFKNDPSNINSLSSNFVRSVCEDKEGNIWIGTLDKGIDKLSITQNRDKTIYRFTHFENEISESDISNTTISERINSIKVDDSGIIWIAGNNGFEKFDTRKNQFYHFRYSANDTSSISSNNVYCITEESKDMLWVGTYGGGLNLFDKKTGKFRRIVNQSNAKNAIISNDITSIFKADSNTLWITTYGGGLIKYDRRVDVFYQFSESDGLPSNIVYSLLEDEKKNFWLSTSNGISHYNLKSNLFTNYSVENGLQNDDFNGTSYFKSSNNQMFFGGNFGYNAFFPDSIKLKESTSNIIFTDFKVFNKQVPIGTPIDGRVLLKKAISYTDTIFLNYTDKTFSLEFAELDYTNPESINYFYKLDGINNEWLNLGTTNSITFHNLQPGEYKLIVKTSNKIYLENEIYRSITIHIKPPLWLTWWFRSLLVLTILVIVIAIIRNRINAIKKQKEILEQIVLERTSELLEINIKLKENHFELLQQKDKVQAHEQELEVFNEELTATNEELHYQREEILAQKEILQIQNDKLKEMDDFKQGMTSMIVHDLKNPLNSIINVPKTINPENQVTIMQQWSKQMLTMVLNILDVHKYEEVKMNLELKEKQIALIALNSIQQVQFLLDQKAVKVINEIESELVAKVDEEVIERVLVNLLTNAIKFTLAGEKITLSSNRISEEMVQISVTDKGDGIAEDKAHLVFQKFGQIVAKKSGGVRSTGLGLSFCKLAVEAHGGEIGFSSALKEGTTFWFTLQLGKTDNIKLQTIAKTEEVEKEIIIFTYEEKQILAPIISQLKAFTVYETDDIEEFLAKLRQNQSENIQKWVSQVKNSIATLNQYRFLELLNIR